MKDKLSLNVRELELRDINLIVDYWLNSEPDFLVSMGVDLKKLPSRDELTKLITLQLFTPLEKKKSYALIWELNEKRVGHSNVTNIEYGKQATMHLHLWKSDNRKKGLGTEFVSKTLPFYFENLKIKKLICEPYALNPAPNRTLKKVGFEFGKKYKVIPGSLNFEQEVNHWELTIEKYKSTIPIQAV